MAHLKASLALLLALAFAAVSGPVQGRVLLGEPEGDEVEIPAFMTSFVATSSQAGVDLSEVSPVVAICLPNALINGVHSQNVANCLRANSGATGPSALPEQCFQILEQANLGPQSTASDVTPYYNCLASAGYRLPSSG